MNGHSNGAIHKGSDLFALSAGELRRPSHTSRTVSREQFSARAISRRPGPFSSRLRISSNRSTVSLLWLMLLALSLCNKIATVQAKLAGLGCHALCKIMPLRRPLANPNRRNRAGGPHRRKAGGLPPGNRVVPKRDIKWSSNEEILQPADLDLITGDPERYTARR
jgi:hypothetical protein